MVNVIKSADRHFADTGWLATHWHFSFGDYHDPENMGWGPLRVFNDDVIHGGGIFGMHPHRNMEIITYVVDGQIEHRDHLGHRGLIEGGEVQVMSAGKGIMHSEANPSKDRDVHLMQLWIEPRKQGTPPRWEQRRFTPAQRSGRLLPVVSGGDIADTLTIDQDAAVYVARLEKGQSVTHQSKPGRKAYLFVIDGALSVNDQPLAGGDQARISDETLLTLRASAPSELILLDLP